MRIRLFGVSMVFSLCVLFYGLFLKKIFFALRMSGKKQ